MPPGANNQLQVTGSTNLGAYDRVNVIFFEIPDSITSPLYFAIFDPETNNSGGGDLDYVSGTPQTDCYLVGGTGTLSDPISRQWYYTSGQITGGQDRLGIQLGHLTYTTGAGTSQQWVYFPAVNPSQGEHIGNKYYFKVVTEITDTTSSKNAYVVDISSSTGSVPTSIPGARAFTYSLCIALRIDIPGSYWYLYPYVPASASGYAVFSSLDFDLYNSAFPPSPPETVGRAFTKAEAGPPGSETGGVDIVYNDGQSNIVANRSYSVTGQVDGVWLARYLDFNSDATPPSNTAEVWFWINAAAVNNEILTSGSPTYPPTPNSTIRIYSSHFTTPTPDHVTVQTTDGVAPQGGTERLNLQLVDNTGAPSLRSVNVRVRLSASSGTYSVAAGSNILFGGGTADAIVQTDDWGFAWIDVTCNAAVTVTVNLQTDGTGGPPASTILPGVNGSAAVAFQADPAPTISSAANLTFTEGPQTPLETITVRDSGTANINTTGDLRIVIPAGLNAAFLTTATVNLQVTGSGQVFGGPTYNGTLTYENGDKTAVITVTTDFAVADVLTIAGLTLAAGNTDSVGQLQLTWNNGANYSTDDKIITILDNGGSYTWTGGAGTTQWENAGNWSGPGTWPQLATDNASIPAAPSFQPHLLAAGNNITINNIMIASGASVTVETGRTLTVGGMLSNDGTVYIEGTGSLALPAGNDPNSGTVSFSGAGTIPSYAGTPDYFNLTVNAGGVNVRSLGGAIDAAGALSISSGVLDLNGQNLTLTNTGFTLSAGTLRLSGGTFTVPGFTQTGGVFNDLAGAGLLSSSGSVALTGGTHTSGTYTLRLTGAGTTLTCSAGRNPYNLTIDSGGTVSLASAAAPGGTVDITAGDTLDVNGNALSVGGNLTNDGSFDPESQTVTFDAASGTVSIDSGGTGAGKRFNNVVFNDGGGAAVYRLSTNDLVALGSLSITGGTLDANGRNLTVGGGWTNNDTFSCGTGLVTFNAASGTVDINTGGVAPANQFYNITFNDGGGTAAYRLVTNGLYAQNDLAITGGTLNANGRPITVGGDWSNGDVFTHGNNTVTLNGGAAQSVDPGASAFYNLTKTGAGVLSLANNFLAVSAQLTIGANAVFDMTNQGFSISVLDCDATGRLDLQGTQSQTITTMDLNSGTVRYYDGAANGTVELPAYFNLTIAGSAMTHSLSAATTVYGNLNIASGTLDVNGRDMTVAGAWANAGVFDPENRTVAFNAAAGTIDIDSGGAGAGKRFNNVVFNDGGGTAVYRLINNALYAAGNLTITGGNFNANGLNLTVGGGWTNSDTFTPGTGTATFTAAAGDVTLNTGGDGAGKAFYNVEFNDGGAGRTFLLGGAIDVDNNLTITAGILDVDNANNYRITVGGNWSNAAGAAGFAERNGRVVFNGNGDTGAETFWQLELSGGTRTSSGDWTVSNAFILTAGTLGPGNHLHRIPGNWNDTAVTFQATQGTMRLTSADPTITAGAANHFFNLDLANGASLATALDCDGGLTIAGTLASNNLAISVGGSWNNTGTFNEGNGTVTFTGDGTVQTAETFFTLEKTGALTTTAFGAAVTVTNSLVISSGAFSAGGNTITVSGTLWRNDVGNAGFVYGTGTVEFTNSGVTTIRGDTEFYNFTCQEAGATLLFEANRTTTVYGTWQVEGASGNLLVLDSTAAPTQWIIAVMGAALVEYVDVRNSNANPNTVFPQNSTDGGNNTNWFFQVVIVGSQTLDLDGDGRIDAVDASIAVGGQLNDQFGGVSASVTGHTVTGITTGAAPFDRTFRILINEGTELDTGDTPLWSLTANSTLRNQVGGAYVQFGTVMTPTDGAAPIIGYSLAAAGRNQVFLHVSERVYNTYPADPAPANFTFLGVNPQTVTLVGTREYLLTFAAPLTLNDAVAGTNVSNSGIADRVGLPLSGGGTHRLSDLILAMPGQEPIAFVAYDSTPREPGPQGIGYITNFDGSGWVQDPTLNPFTLTGTLVAGANAELIGIVDTVNTYQNIPLWYPDPVGPPAVAAVYGLVPQFQAGVSVVGNTGANYILNLAALGMTSESLFEFYIRFGGGILYARLARPNDGDWYRSVRPFAFGCHRPGGQKGGVEIYNNVINPNNGEVAKIRYVLPRDGNVTIQVFNLNGDLVGVLYRGWLAAGQHSTGWNGRNQGGRVVARGLYFIKVVGPGIDETRKVLVVK